MLHRPISPLYFYILLLVSCSLVVLFPLPNIFLDSKLLLFLIGSLTYGIFMIKYLFARQAPLKLPFAATCQFSFLSVVLYIALARNHILTGSEGDLITLLGCQFIAGDYVRGFLLTLTHGLLPVLVFFALIQSCEKPTRDLTNPYLYSSLSRFFYVLPALIYFIIIVSFVSYLYFHVQVGGVEYTIALKQDLEFLAGSTLFFSLGICFFYLPVTLLYLSRSRNLREWKLINLSKFLQRSILPLLILLPLVNSIYFLVNDSFTKQMTFAAIPVLVPYLYLPMAILLSIALSKMRRKLRSGYIMTIVLMTFFMLLNFSFVSLILGIVVIYYAADELRHDV